MSIYIKLAQARVKLQDAGLEKTGRNHFIKVKVRKVGSNGKEYFQEEPMPYFELKDFLPRVNEIFRDLNMVSVVSFDKELATLTLYDGESSEKITFTSPMANIPITDKNGNFINSNTLTQSIGASETYQRRYLYMTALEIVESDWIDSQDFSAKSEDPKQKYAPQSAKSTPQPTNSTPPTVQETFKNRFSGCQTKEQMAEMYDKLLDWTQKHHPDLVDELGIIYNDAILNLM